MKKIFFVVCVLSSIVCYSQAPNYIKFNERRHNLAFSTNAFNLPSMATPALQTGQYVRSGAMIYDSTGGNRGIHVWTGSAWIKLADTTYTGFGSFLSSVGSGYKVAVEGTSSVKSIGQGKLMTIDSATSGQVGISFGGRSTSNIVASMANNTLIFDSLRSGYLVSYPRTLQSTGVKMVSTNNTDSALVYVSGDLTTTQRAVRLQANNTASSNVALLEVRSGVLTDIQINVHGALLKESVIAMDSNAVQMYRRHSPALFYPSAMDLYDDSAVLWSGGHRQSQSNWYASGWADQWATDSLVWRTLDRHSSLTLNTTGWHAWEDDGDYWFYNTERITDTTGQDIMVLSRSGEKVRKIPAGIFGGGGGGSGTVNSGTQYRIGYYATTGTAISEAAAITAARALISDANGGPTHSTTTATQLAYLNAATGTTGTTSTNLVFSTSPTLTTPNIGAATGTSLSLSTSANQIVLNNGTENAELDLDASYVLNFGHNHAASDNVTQYNMKYYSTGGHETRGLKLSDVGNGFTTVLSQTASGALYWTDGAGAAGALGVGSWINPNDGSTITNGTGWTKLNGQNFGIRTTPTAYLHIAAGTTTAGTAPIKIDEGAKLTTPEDGTIEKDDAFYFTKTNAVRYAPGGSVISVYTDVGNVGTGEDDLMTGTVLGGTLSQDGDHIKFQAYFTIAGDGTLKMYFGATQLFSHGALATHGVYRVTGEIIRTGAATQKVTYEISDGLGAVGSGFANPTETLSGNVALKGTYEGVSNNDGVQKALLGQFYPKP